MNLTSSVMMDNSNNGFFQFQFLILYMNQIVNSQNDKHRLWYKILKCIMIIKVISSWGGTAIWTCLWVKYISRQHSIFDWCGAGCVWDSVLMTTEAAFLLELWNMGLKERWHLWMWILQTTYLEQIHLLFFLLV